MKVTYKEIPERMRCPYQGNSNICFPGCSCSSEKICWKTFEKEMSGIELRELLQKGMYIEKVEK